MSRPNAVFTIYYGPRPRMKFYHRTEHMPRRESKPWMVGCAIGKTGDWAPGVQRTLVGAIWATWRLYRRMSKDAALSARNTRENQA